MLLKKLKSNVNPLEGNILKGIIAFSIPLMLVYLLQVLFQMADTIVVGNFGSEDAMSSIGVTASMINLIIALGMGLGTGVSVTLGRLYGENNKERINKIFLSVPLTALIIGCVLAGIAIPLARVLLILVDVPNNLLDNATLYFRIYFLCVPFSLAFNFLNAGLQAKGDTVHPLVFQLIAGVINIVLNLLFVIVFKWNVAGVAIATVISQVVAFTCLFVYLLKRDDELKLELKKLTAFKNMKMVFLLGFPACFSNVMLDISNVLIQSTINTFDDIAIAGNTAAASVEGFLWIAFIGISSGSVVYISQNYGAKNYDRIWRTFWITFFAVLVFGEIVGLFVYFTGPYILKLYGIGKEEIESGMIRMFYMGCFYALCGEMNILNGCIKGLHYAKIPMAISMVCAGILRTAWILVVKYTPKLHKLENVYIAYPICWALSTILCVIFFIILFNRRKEEYKNSLC